MKTGDLSQYVHGAILELRHDEGWHFSHHEESFALKDLFFKLKPKLDKIMTAWIHRSDDACKKNVGQAE